MPLRLIFCGIGGALVTSWMHTHSCYRYTSYVRIMHSISEEPLPRDTFNQRMNALKRPAHVSILKTNRQGWYEFDEAVVRG